MSNKTLFVSIFIFFGICCGSLLAEPVTTEDTMPQQLSWQEVPGASGYILEIRNSNGYQVLSEKTTANAYTLVNFTSGMYEHRVGAVNKLGKVSGYSEWVPFEVIVSRIPSLTKNSVFSFSKEEKQKVLILEGKDFIDSMKVYMVIGSKKIPAKKVVLESGTVAKATFDIYPDLDTGIYDLVLENPRKKTLTAKQRVVVSDSKERAARFASRQERIINKEIPEDYYETPYWSTFWRSSILPGWGQTYIDGQNWKLYVYPVVAAGILGAYASSYSKFQSAKSSYESTVLMGVFLAEDPNTQFLWLLNRNSAQANFNSAKQQLNVIQAGAGVFGLFILYNLVDSYFSARRNIAWEEPKPGFPILEENVRVSARLGADSIYSYSSQPIQYKTSASNYQLEFSLRY